mgnify:FL=1
MRALLTLACLFSAGVVHALLIGFPEGAQRDKIKDHLDSAERIEKDMSLKRGRLEESVADKLV